MGAPTRTGRGVCSPRSTPPRGRTPGPGRGAQRLRGSRRPGDSTIPRIVLRALFLRVISDVILRASAGSRAYGVWVSDSFACGVPCGITSAYNRGIGPSLPGGTRINCWPLPGAHGDILVAACARHSLAHGQSRPNSNEAPRATLVPIQLLATPREIAYHIRRHALRPSGARTC